MYFFFFFFFEIKSKCAVRLTSDSPSSCISLQSAGITQLDFCVDAGVEFRFLRL